MSVPSEVSLLNHLEALTYDFDRAGEQISCVLIYAEPDPDQASRYRVVSAEDTGYEGIACLDDTARAARLALLIYERTKSRKALSLAKRWLTFVQYMQYPDGSFANFIRNSAGVRNATGPTSVKGGYWWSARALWTLATAYRVTRRRSYLDQYEACRLAPLVDGKINSVLALAELELYQAVPDPLLARSIVDRCQAIVGPGTSRYFLDHPETGLVHFWGYHQLHALACAARLLNREDLIPPCEMTVQNLVEPSVAAKFWYSYPDKDKDGVCAYAVTPLVQGLTELYRSTGCGPHRKLALDAAAWFYGRNDARTRMYDPTTGKCRDGISAGVASLNCGAESTIEAGFSELERRELLGSV